MKECGCRIICEGPKWTMKIVYCGVHDKAFWMEEELDRLINLEGDMFRLLQICKRVKDYLDHPDQRNATAWEIISTIEHELNRIELS